MTSTTAIAQEATQSRAGVRYWEIDAMRGVVIITMIVYHLMWDLRYLGVFPDVVLGDGFWKYFQRFTASTFIFLAGVSMTMVYRRGLGVPWARLGPGTRLYPKFLLRGLMIFGFGMLISLVVLGAGIGYVDFGVLHLIGFSIVVAYPFLRFKWPNLGVWVVFLMIGGWLQQVHFDGRWFILQVGSWTSAPIWIDGRWLAPLGVTPTRYAAVDYFPIFPWFGVVPLGIWFGNWFYAGNRRLMQLPDASGYLPFALFQLLGRNSLVIYLVHQPLLFALLFALGISRP